MQDIEKNAVRIGKLISCALRHKPEILNLVMDKEGWVNCAALIGNVAKRYGGFTKVDLDYIVENNNKKRYSYNDDQTKIRANQGHSVEVDVSLEQLTEKDNIPEFLYHGTSKNAYNQIKIQGLKPMARLYVHLSKDYKTAESVGLRYAHTPSELVVIKIDAKRFVADKNPLYLSKNGIYLAKSINPKYFVHE